MQFFYKWIRNALVVISCLIIQSASFASPNLEGIQIYPSLPSSEVHKQKLANDVDRFHNAENLWDVLRDEFTLPHYEDNPYVQHQIDWFVHHQDYLTKATTHAAPYLYFILQQARMRHLPAEVVLLPMIESTYNPFVNSSAGAAGIWQMMPGTASGYGVKRDWFYDGRRDIVASTRAALGYLAFLGSYFDGNWLLAIAAYDTGEGNVIAAIKKNVRDGKNADFWDLPLAQETRDYIPRLLALAVIITHPEKYPLTLPNVPNAPYLAEVDVGGQISLQEASTLAGLTLAQLKQLNAAYNQNTTAQHGPKKIILPIENVQQFAENLAASPDVNIVKSHEAPEIFDQAKAERKIPDVHALPEPMKALEPVKMLAPIRVAFQTPEKMIEKKELKPGDTLYAVREYDTVEKIATRFKMPINVILTANHLRSNERLTEGRELIIPTHLNQPEVIPIMPGDTIYMVRSGDTVETIAAKFHMNAATLRAQNLIGSGNIQEGDRLVIPTRLA